MSLSDSDPPLSGSWSRMSDTSIGSERSVDISINEDVEVKDAGVQTCFRSPRSRQTSSCSDEVDGAMAAGDHVHRPKISWEEKLKNAKKYKFEGNENYKSGSFKSAIGKYHRALLFLKGLKEPEHEFRLLEAASPPQSSMTPEALEESTQLECDCFNNLSGTKDIVRYLRFYAPLWFARFQHAF